MIEFLLNVFSSIPHLNFKFQFIENHFNIDWKSEYAQSLVLVSAACAIITILLLLTIVINWICQCCSRDPPTGKSKRKVRRLSFVLFIISVFCFFFLGVCLFGNEHINRGVTYSSNGLGDIQHEFKIAVAQATSLNETCQNATLHIRQLVDQVHKESRKPGINDTLVAEVDEILTSLSDNVDDVTSRLNGLVKILGGVNFLQNAKFYGDRIELERWILVVTLLSIMLCVLFIGVISFCRKSKKGAVVFSGLGIVIFLVVWILFCFVLPMTVALADFCSSGGEFIRSKLDPPMINALEYYRTCDPRPTHDNVPPIFGAGNMSDALSDMQTGKAKLDSLLDRTFNHSLILANYSAVIGLDATRSLKSIGALESSLACYAYTDDVQALHYGVCNQAVIGSSILSGFLLLLGIFLFILLVIVSKSWNLFTRLPSDYVEVDEEDPFFPRTNDSNIPVDIYGTHVFNPRTRDRTEPSTNTTTATGNGIGAMDETAPALWNRSSVTPGNRTSYNDHPYGNYADHYDT